MIKQTKSSNEVQVKLGEPVVPKENFKMKINEYQHGAKIILIPERPPVGDIYLANIISPSDFVGWEKVYATRRTDSHIFKVGKLAGSVAISETILEKVKNIHKCKLVFMTIDDLSKRTRVTYWSLVDDWINSPHKPYIDGTDKQMRLYISDFKNNIVEFEGD